MKLIEFLRNYIKINNRKIWIFITVISYFIPLIFFIHKIYIGAFPFWYDPARDLLLSLDSIKKPTLIGPPSGIPGLFYGPYWIWILSIGQIINKDPRFVLLIAGIIPYFILFPLLLLRFSAIFGKLTTIFLWLLFMLGFNHYATTLWNPNLAPVILLGIFYLITFNLSLPTHKKEYSSLLLLGFLSGLLVNFHISFGSVVFAGVSSFIFVHMLWMSIKTKSVKSIINMFLAIALFSIGFLISVLPFIIFELRHNLLQSKVILNMITNSVLYNSAVVGQTGMNDKEIIFSFFNIFSKILVTPFFITPIIFLSGIISMFYFLICKIEIDEKLIKLTVLIFVISISLLLVYTSSKNPVWEYHFVGVEMLILFFIAVLTYKNKVLRTIFVFWAFYVTLQYVNSYAQSLKTNPHNLPASFASRSFVIDAIFKDASKNNDKFSVTPYSPSIYTYEYDYLITIRDSDSKNMYTKDTIKAKTDYIVIPYNTSKAIEEDFIHYKSKDQFYKMIKTWNLPDGTKIIKRNIIN